MLLDLLWDRGEIAIVGREGNERLWDLAERRYPKAAAVLSPFDDLISDRRRTEELFDFRYRLQIYVPKAKREHGYFALPILRGDRVVGRADLAFDRASRTLRGLGIWAEDHARPSDWASTRRALDDLGAWLGAVEVALPARAAMPAIWR